MANEYWEKRYEHLLDESFQKANLTDEEIKANYVRALRRIEKAINDWYRRFATENGIQLAEARKLLNAYEMKAFKMDLAEFKAEAKKIGVSEEHQQMLSNASIRERLSREQMLYINVIHEIEMLSQRQNISIQDVLQDVYTKRHILLRHNEDHIPILIQLTASVLIALFIANGLVMGKILVPGYGVIHQSWLQIYRMTLLRPSLLGKGRIRWQTICVSG